MGSYRLYYLDARGKIFATAEIDARSDTVALELARAKAGSCSGAGIELWQRNRRIWPPGKPAAQQPAAQRTPSLALNI